MHFFNFYRFRYMKLVSFCVNYSLWLSNKEESLLILMAKESDDKNLQILLASFYSEIRRWR